MTSWVVTPAPRSRLAELRTMLTALDHPAAQCAVISVGPHPIRPRDIDDLAAHLIHVPNPLPLFGAWLNTGFHYIAQIDPGAEVLCIGSSLTPGPGLVQRLAHDMRQRGWVMASPDFHQRPTHELEGPRNTHDRISGHCFMVGLDFGLRCDPRFRWWYTEDDLEMQARQLGPVGLVGACPVRHRHFARPRSVAGPLGGRGPGTVRGEVGLRALVS